MKQFTYSKQAIKSLALKKVVILIPLISIILITVFFTVNHFKDNAFLEDQSLMFIVIGVLVFIVIGGSISSKKTIEKILSETRYIITDTSIEEEIPNGDNTKIVFRDIRSFQKQNNGILLKAKNNQIKISNRISNFEELQKLLVQNVNTGIIYNDTKFKINDDIKKYMIGILTISALAGLILLQDKYHKLYLGIPLVCGLAYASFFVANDKNTAVEVRKLLPKLSLIILGIIGYLIYQFFAV